jgi:hypothetical protein
MNGFADKLGAELAARGVTLVDVRASLVEGEFGGTPLPEGMVGVLAKTQDKWILQPVEEYLTEHDDGAHIVAWTVWRNLKGTEVHCADKS